MEHKMDENIMVNVEFTGRDDDSVTEVQVVPCTIAWEDFELMLKVYSDQENISVSYIDEECDSITINSQEELKEAFKVARKFNNTLSLRVVCVRQTTPKEGANTETVETIETIETIEDGVKVTADVNQQKVIMKAQKVVCPEEVGCEVVCPGATMEVMEVPQRQDENCVVIDVDEPEPQGAAAATKEESDHPKKALFFLRHQNSGLVLDINGGNPSAGIKVILWEKKPHWMGVNNQLWYLHENTGTLRSLLNDYCLDANGEKAVMTPYLYAKNSQQWLVSEGRIQHRFNPHWVISAHGNPGGAVFAGEIEDHPQAVWTAETWVMKKAANKETGEQCLPVDHTRPSHRDKVKGYYAHLAKNVGKMYGQGRGGNSHPAEGQPPTWFSQYMERFKSDIGEDMARLVARKTVRQVLQGLEGAVVTSVQGTSGLGPRPPTSPAGNRNKDEHRVLYHHIGVVCDNCEREIVGIRYNCGNCPDYDLCEECELLEGVHNAEHVFLKIRRPVALLGLKKNGKKVPLLRRNLYRAAEEEENRHGERQKRKAERMEEKMKKQEERLKHREEKLKRRLEQNKDRPNKKERLDLPQFRNIERMDAEFLRDDTIPDGTHVQPGTKLVKRWVMKNTGTHPWTSRTMLKMIWGNLPPVQPEVSVPYLKPEEEGIITVELVAPEPAGTYQSHWRLVHHGARFGHRVWCQISVDPKETLDGGGETSKVDFSVVKVNIIDDQPDVKDSDKYSDLEEVKVDEEVKVTTEVKVKHEMDDGEIRVSTETKSDGSSAEAAAQLKSPTQGHTTRVIDAEAAAQLKSPTQGHTTRVIDADILTAQDLLSFEMLDIGVRQPRVSQTATPNNTPLDISPPKSPAPELDLDAHLSSNSSSVELVNETGVSLESEADLAMMESLVQERMASLGMRPHTPDLDMADMADIESLSTLSDDSTDTDSEFYIVPIPDCFIPQLPASKGASTSIYVKKEERSVDDMLTASSNLELEPLLPQRSVPPPPPANLTEPESEEDNTLDVHQLVAADSQEEPDVVIVKVVPPPGEEENQEEEVPVVSNRTAEEPCGNDNPQCPDPAEASPEPQEVAPEPQEVAPEPQEVAPEPQDVALEPQGAPPAPQDTDDHSDSDENANLPIDYNHNESPVPVPQPTAEEMCPERQAGGATGGARPRDTTSPSNRAGASSLVTLALGVAGQAAASAYSTAKDVFHTLQAKQQYVPPKSEWQPSPSNYQPPQSEWTPPANTFVPPKSEWTPPKTTWTLSEAEWPPLTASDPEADAEERVPPSPMDNLVEMGFGDRILNRRLLDKHNDNLDKVIQELIQIQDNHWAAGRH